MPSFTPVPSSIQPAPGSTITTNTPILSAFIDGKNNGPEVGNNGFYWFAIEFWLATDSGFTTNVRKYHSSEAASAEEFGNQQGSSAPGAVYDPNVIVNGTFLRSMVARTRVTRGGTPDWGVSDTGPNLSTPVPSVNEHHASQPTSLFQGTWYIKARCTKYRFPGNLVTGGHTGKTVLDWSATQSFTVSNPPTSSFHNPSGGLVLWWGVGASATPTLSWEFTDAFEDDVQSAYQIIVERNGDSTVLFDSGKVSSDDDEVVVTIAPSEKNRLLRWKVRLWDVDDAVGPYSDYQTFYLVDLPEVEVVEPDADEVVESPVTPIQWTFAADDLGVSPDTIIPRIQAQYKIEFGLQGESDSFFDSGWQAGDDLTWTPSQDILDNLGEFWVRVIVRDSGNLSNDPEDVDFTTDYPRPATVGPLVVDVAPYEDEGYVKLTWTDAGREPDDWLRYDVYRRPVGDAEWTFVGSDSTIAANYEMHDWLPGAHIEYEWALTQVVSLPDTMVEINSLADVASPATPVGTHYWLIDLAEDDVPSSGTEDSLKLEHVTDEGYNDDYEQESFLLVGRGRHTDYGERLGRDGSLSAEIRDRSDKTAREQRQTLEHLKTKKTTLWLRNPFGDVLPVAAGNLQFQREPGQGIKEFGVVTIPYEEVLAE